MAMKTFTSLFALLSCLSVYNAQAEVYEPSVSNGECCIFLETNNNQDAPYIYVWDSNNASQHNNGWPNDDWRGVAMELKGTIYGNSNRKIYKWTKPDNQNWTPNMVIFYAYNGDGNRYQSKDLVFNSGDYYIDLHGNPENMSPNHNVNVGYTVYFFNDQGWDNVYLHAWNANNKAYRDGWPGSLMTPIENNIYKCHVNDNTFNGVIFNNGPLDNFQEGINKTSDLSAENGKCYTISEELGFTINNEAIASANYSRNTGDNHWGTLCLPFEFKNSYDGVTFYQLSSVTETSMKFTPIEGTIAAGTPVAFKLDEPGELNIAESNVTVVADPTTAGISNWTMKGTFQRKTLDGIYYVYNDKYYCGDNITVKPYRGWFETSAPTNGALFRIEIEEEQSLQFVEQEDGTVMATFDLQGRKLDNARKGLVIENGKIIMIK